ncbi:MAG TPA: hypothetical protein VJW77_03090 [Terriglobia bacterium]|nr:hypothetical protein [Terriglobia bacterium]
MAVRADIETKEKESPSNPLVPDIIQEAAAITALVTTSQQSALLANLSMSNSVLQANLAQQNMVGNQRSLGEVGIISTAKAASLVRGLGVAEAKASSEYLTSDATAEQIAELKAVVEDFSGGGSGPVPPPRRKVYLPANPLGPPYKAVAPTHLVLLNVASPDNVIIDKVAGETQTVVKFTARNIMPLPPLPKKAIPVPIPSNAQVLAHVPLLIAYDNDYQTKVVQVSDLTAEKGVEIT